MKSYRELISTFAYKITFRLYRLFHGKPQAYFQRINGIIHIGASTGQEREHYSQEGLNVLWIEAIPSVFNELVENLKNFPRQKALNYLLDSCNKDSVRFNISSNSGESSSLLALGDHQRMYPDVTYVECVNLNARTLDWVIENESIDLSLYDSLILDVQGAELRVLEGASNAMTRMRFIEVEVADFRSYTGCPVLQEMTHFMEAHGFILEYLQRVSFSPGIGTYYNATYKNHTLKDL